MELVISNLSFEIRSNEKIGIVGRTGAGKSSITLALFRNTDSDIFDISKDNFCITFGSVLMCNKILKVIIHVCLSLTFDALNLLGN